MTTSPEISFPVYCSDCKHLGREILMETLVGEAYSHKCEHPREMVAHRTYLCEEMWSETECCEKNAGNDCEDFEVMDGE